MEGHEEKGGVEKSVLHVLGLQLDRGSGGEEQGVD